MEPISGQRIWHIDIPGILPTVVMMLILEVGKVMNLGFQKAYFNAECPESGSQ